MHSEATNKLLGHLYDIVPAKETKSTIESEIFPGNSKVSVDDILNELLGEGYIYQWKNEPGEKTDEYGITPQGILFFDHFAYEIQHPKLAQEAKPAPVPVVSDMVSSEALVAPPEKQPFSLWKIIPVIILIAFAIGLIYIITHTKNSAI